MNHRISVLNVVSFGSMAEKLTNYTEKAISMSSNASRLSVYDVIHVIEVDDF